MSANYSSATRVHAYQPTIIESKVLISRLAIQLAFLKDECKRDPRAFAPRLAEDSLTNPKFIMAVVVAALTFAAISKAPRLTPASNTVNTDDASDVVMLPPIQAIDGTGRVGINDGSGEGSGPTKRLAQGGGTGGDHSLKPPQTGKLPPPSDVLASIPIKPPIYS